MNRDPIRHPPGCPADDLHTFDGRLGDLMARCRGCGRTAPAGPAEPKSDTEADEKRPAPRYVCRPHYHPVRRSPRGYATGCPRCDRDRHNGRRKAHE